MTTKYDVVYYWTGGDEVGRWKATLGYSDEMLADIRRMGYCAVPGKRSIGSPEGNPLARQPAASR